MGRRSSCVLLGILFSSLPFYSISETPEALKFNLDLPYDAGGSAEDEEELAPEIVVFFGQGYEADAVVFALDESGSMQDNGRWQIQTRQVTTSISELSDRSEFGVVYYGGRVNPYREQPVAATSDNKSTAKNFIRSRRPDGDTCLFEGLIKALEIVRKSANQYKAVILTSDGRPDVCSTGDLATSQQIEGLLQRTVQANPGRLVKVHTIWVGSGSDGGAIQFMKRLAETHGGTFQQINR